MPDSNPINDHTTTMQLPRLKHRIHQSRAGQIHYWLSEEINSRLPWLVWLPGLTADHRLFLPQLEYFQDQANLLVWDPPAHGKSKPYDLAEFTVDGLARRLHDILQAEGIEKPILVGLSYGGYVAQGYLHNYPQAADGVIIMDSAPLKKQYFKRYELWALANTHTLLKLMPWRLLVKSAVKAAACTVAGQKLMRTWMEETDRQAYIALTVQGYKALGDAINLDLPYEINVSALIICGELDKAGTAKTLNKKWAATEKLPIVWVPKAGHLSTIDNPDAVNTAISEFLKKFKES